MLIVVKLDKDLEELSKAVTSIYDSERSPAQGSAQVHIIQAVRDLTKIIIKLNDENNKLSKRVFLLTLVTVFLALVQISVAVIQIWY